MVMTGLDRQMGEVTRAPPIAVDKAALPLPAPWGIDPRLNCGRQPSLVERIGTCRTPSGASWRAIGSKTKSSCASIDRCIQPGATRFARHCGTSAVVSVTRCLWPARAFKSLLDETTNLRPSRTRDACRPRSRNARSLRLRISDPTAPAQRQFDERRARPLSRSQCPCAGDDARASRRPILVSGFRPAHFARGPRLAPFVPGPLSGRISVVDQGDCRPAAAGRDARAPAASRTTCTRASDRRRTSADRRLGQAQLRPLSARHRAADRSRREDWRADADLELKALAARADRPARGPGGPYPGDQAEAGFSRTCDHLEPVHGPQQPERPPQNREAFARILANVRKHAPATSTPPRVLICRSPSNSRNVTNRAADDRGA